MSEGGQTAHRFWADSSDDESLHTYRTLVDTIDDAIYQLDADGRFVAVNDVLLATFGYAREELLEGHVSTLADDATAERVSDVIRKLRTNPEDGIVTLDVPARRADGERLPIELRVNPLEDTGEVTGFVGVVRERQPEPPASGPESELAEITDRISDGFFALDEDWKFTHVNQSAHDILNLGDGELVGKNIWDEFPAATERKFKQYYERAMTEQVTVSFEEYYPEPLDSWFEVNAYPSETGLSVYFREVTDRKEREQRFEQYETIVETMDDGIYVKNEEGRLTMVNEAYAEMVGYDREELVGAHASLVVDESAITEPRQRTETPTDTAPTMEAALETADGDSVPAEATFAMVETDGEEQEVGVVRDITERKEYERRIEASERRYRTLAEHFPDGAVGVYDHDLQYSLTAGAALGDRLPPSDDLEGERMPDVFPEHTVDDLEPLFRTTLEDGETGSTMTEFDGRHWQVWTVPLRDGAGGISGGLSFVQDITEQVERERDLEVRTHQQAVVAELGKYALEVNDPDELMDVASRRVAEVLDNDYCKVLDLDTEERDLLLRQGVGWRDGIVGSATVDADDNSQAGYTLLSQEPVVVEDLETETRFQGPDLLTSHDVTSGISTIIGSLDEPWGILGTHDTTSRTFSKEDVAFVQTVANILAESIERDRYNAELERTIRELEESNTRLEQFAYAASHDLQEPLRMVSSYLSLIERRYEDVLDEDGQEFLEYAVDGAERMREMIDALLAYSRVDTRGDPFDLVDLQATMESVLSDYQMKLEETDANVSTTELPTVYGDESQLQQVFGNLVSNALEYSGDEPPTVRVSAERDGDRWVVGVKDEGIGIDSEHQERVFEVFQRLHSQEEHGGTGIGLALAQRIVERHDGEIWVESEPGKGSTFYCSLPVVEETNE